MQRKYKKKFSKNCMPYKSYREDHLDRAELF